MQRSPGVVAVAVAVLVGSILIIALGVLTAGLALVIPRIPPPQGRPPLPVVGFLLLGSLTYLLPGIWGVVSGIGLLRLKNWARISTIVFAVLAGFAGVGMLALVLLLFGLPLPEGSLDPVAATRGLVVVRTVVGVLSMLLLGAALWFGILLTRPRVARQFTGLEGTAGARPLSITIIAVLMLMGAPFTCIGAMMRAPVPLFSTLLTGAAAAVFSLAVTATLAYCGWGLFRVKPMARLIAIGYFVFAILSSSVFFLAPGREARITAVLDRQPSLLRYSPTSETRSPSPQMFRVFMVFGLIGGFVGAAVPLYFLIVNGAAFKEQAPAG